MAEYKYEFVKVRIHDGIAWTALNRPEKRNAMSPALHYEMDDALMRLETDDDVKVVVVTGEGGNFSAGTGSEEVLPRAGEESGGAQEGPGRRQSLALGTALRLRQADHRHGARLLRGRRVHAAAGVRFRDRGRERDILALGGELGHSPRRAGGEGGADMVLPRHALYYACLGDAFDGKEAARIGMINFAVPLDKLEAATTDLAERLMKKSPAVLRATKQAIRHVRTMDVAQAYDYLAEKGKAIKVADNEDSYNTGLRQFLDEKSYKPTYEPFKLGTMLTDQRAKPAAKK